MKIPSRAKKSHPPTSTASRNLAALDRFSQTLSEGGALDDLLSRALDAILEQTHAAAARVWLIDSEKNLLQFHLHRGLFPEIFSQPSTFEFDSSPTARAAQTLQTIHLKNLGALPALQAKGFVEFVSVPLVASNQAIAVLDIAARHRHELNAPTLKLIESMGRILAIGIEKTQWVTRAESREADLRRLWEAGLDVTDSQEYAHVLRTIVDRARELIGGEASALCLWDENKRWWVVQGTSGSSDAFEVSVKRIESQSGSKPVECPVIRFKYRQAHLDVPVMHEGRVVGCLCIASQHARDFSSQEHELLAGIAAQAARAIETSRQIETAGTRATTAERSRLAREMHDTLAQMLGFVNIKTQAAREFLAQGQYDQAKIQLDQLSKLAQELYADTRELILGLHSETGPERGLVPALEEYTRQFDELSGIQTTFHADGFAELTLTPATEVQLLRVVQEALSNVRKHARADRASVRFERNGDFARVEIADDGQGFDPGNLARGQFPQFGLTSMRERVESLSGQFRVESAEGHGTKIQIEFPLVYRGEK